MEGNSDDLAIVIDGNAMIYRAYYGSQSVAIREGKSDEEIMGYMHRTIASLANMFNSWLSRREYRYAVVVFDSSRDTFRRERLAQYKANRPPMPRPLLDSLQEIKDALRSRCGLVIMAAPAPFEGDDMICSLAHLFNGNGVSVDIFSTDKDMLQLVNDRTTVNIIAPGKGGTCVYDMSTFHQLTGGLSPEQIPLLKAIAGDPSDNYQGLPGMGIKTTTDILRKYGTISEIYENLDNLKPKLREKFINGREMINLFLSIATTVSDLELSRNLGDYERVR